MARIAVFKTIELTENGWQTLAELSYDAAHVPMRADRSIAQQANANRTSANTTAGTAGTSAATERSTLIPGLTNDVTHPTGYTPEQKNNMLVAEQEAAGGGNAAATGEGTLAALRTRTAGGYAPALAEAARAKGRTLASGALQVENEDARLAQQKRSEALRQLQGLYGTDTSNQLRAMGLSDEALQDELAAGRQGWLQNTEGVLNTLSGMGASAAGVKKAFAP